MTKKPSKGELTTARILDAAEQLFAQKGYDATSIRQIAAAAGIREPGLYNYFKSKLLLYTAVLDRALSPMLEAMNRHLQSVDSLRAFSELPIVMTDLLLAHPNMPALYQQALQGDLDSVGNQLMKKWLDQLFTLGLEARSAVSSADEDR